MARTSTIEWTESTFNPWIGCTKVSPGCEHCYAEMDSKRRGWAEWGKGNPRKHTSKELWKQPIKWNQEAAQAGRRRRVFCASLADVFDAEVASEWREELWCLIRSTPCLDWLILTKRPQNFTKMLPKDWGNGWQNVCLMTSVEDQARASRVENLIHTPARFRALSVEPLLGPVRLNSGWMEKLDWIIVGGESGHGARPMQLQWVRDIRDQCQSSGVKFLFKQWGCWTPDDSAARDDLGNAAYFSDALTNKPTLLGGMGTKERRQFQLENTRGYWMYRTTKKAAGNTLDGKRHREHPFGKTISKAFSVAPLTRDETNQLEACEQTIRQGLGKFVEVGIALMQIRNARLYREKYKTFEEYVQAVIALSRPHAYQLMESAQVMQDLSSIEDISRLPTNEAQARELVRIKGSADRIEAWRTVINIAGDEPLTARKVRETLKLGVGKTSADNDNHGQKIRLLLARLRRLFSESRVGGEAEKLLRELERLAVV